MAPKMGQRIETNMAAVTTNMAAIATNMAAMIAEINSWTDKKKWKELEQYQNPEAIRMMTAVIVVMI
jgi:hypothetical protein